MVKKTLLAKQEDNKKEDAPVDRGFNEKPGQNKEQVGKDAHEAKPQKQQVVKKHNYQTSGPTKKNTLISKDKKEMED